MASFVSFGGHRIKASIIKEYYITKTPDKKFSDPGPGNTLLEIAVIIANAKGVVIKKGKRVLVVRTPKQTYKFIEGECGFDIDDKVRELDRIL